MSPDSQQGPQKTTSWRRLGEHVDRVLRAVQRRARDLGHAGVDLRERVPLGARVDDVDARCDQRPGVRDEVRAGLDLQMQRAVMLLPKADELLLHGCTALGEIRRLLAGDARDLEAAAEVHGGHLGQRSGDLERHARHALPHGGIGAGADVRVEPPDVQAVARGDRLHVGEVLVPDAELEPGPQCSCGSSSRYRGRGSCGRRRRRRERPAVLLELVARAGVVEHAALDDGAGSATAPATPADALGRRAGMGARSTSKSLDASMWSPSSRNRRRMAAFGFAFIA
jgi:hypothetical protein